MEGKRRKSSRQREKELIQIMDKPENKQVQFTVDVGETTNTLVTDLGWVPSILKNLGIINRSCITIGGIKLTLDVTE